MDRQFLGSTNARFPTTVTLVADPYGYEKMFFCPNCQAPYTKYTGTLISIMPGLPPVEPYARQRCRNSRCPAEYIITGVVEMSRDYYVEN